MFDLNLIGDVLWKSILSFIILLILTRFLGKQQMSQLTFFNYVTGITIGSIAANAVGSEGAEFFENIYGLTFWSIFVILVSIIVLKVPSTTVLFHGQPSILIKKGKIQYVEMRRSRIDIDNLKMMLRENQVFSVTEVDYAILEHNGQLSILKKVDNLNPTNKDLNVKLEQPKYMPMEIITDGKLLKKNLKEYDLSEKWLYSKLNEKGIKDIKEVLFAELQSDGSLHVDKKEK
ncbi:MAG: hypothetical protein K0Q49_249 [Haloplasmataceae bacterium]|jgi:uncharacterized membrane protein YcaP (DUF421 family)|nr:hypothetical protein [Haloplasmataceae bacterium]